jgi:hypothetical protein
MIRKLLLFIILPVFSTGLIPAQSFMKTSDLLRRSDLNSIQGHLKLIQDPAIDTLINRYILAKIYAYNNIGYKGMEGFRIQIYSSSNRNAREESGKVNAVFLSKFPDIRSYPLFARPGYYKIRVGDFRTKTEATRLFLMISKDFPEAYIVPDIINFPDQNTK